MNKKEQIVKEVKGEYCIVLPSLWEGLPLTLFESLASARPVVVSDILAYKSVIKDEALFFKTGDSGDLKNKIEMLIKDKIMAKKIALKGEKLSGKYDWNIIAEDLIKIYNKHQSINKMI